MKIDRVKAYIAHYFYGLFAAGWNGGWNAVAGIFGIDAVAIAGPTPNVRVLNGHEMAAAFGGAFLIHAVLWLKSHPIPAELPDEEPTPTP